MTNQIGQQIKAICLTQQQGEALDRLIQYNWRDELEDYRECETVNEENLRVGHIFTDLVMLDNALNDTGWTPEDHLEETK
jgi:hypothetical protein